MKIPPKQLISILLFTLVASAAGRAEANDPVRCYKSPNGSDWNGVCCNQPGAIKKTGPSENYPFDRVHCEKMCKGEADWWNSKSCKDDFDLEDDEELHPDAAVARFCKPDRIINWPMGKSMYVWADNWTGCGKGGASGRYTRGNGPKK